MAIGAKMSFLKQLEKKLSDTVTVDGMARLLSAVADVAEGFDMQEITAAVRDGRYQGDADQAGKGGRCPAYPPA